MWHSQCHKPTIWEKNVNPTIHVGFPTLNSNKILARQLAQSTVQLPEYVDSLALVGTQRTKTVSMVRVWALETLTDVKSKSRKPVTLPPHTTQGALLPLYSGTGPPRQYMDFFFKRHPWELP